MIVHFNLTIMKTFIAFGFAVMSLVAYGQGGPSGGRPVVSSELYEWKEPTTKQAGLNSSVIFEGSAYDFEYMAMDACVITSKKTTMLEVPKDQEHLLMVKSGRLKISFGDSTWAIGPGSVALLLPSEKFSIAASDATSCKFYRMKYRSKDPIDIARGRNAGGSFVKDWDKLRFREHSRGGVRSYFERPTAMSKRFEMHVTTLNPDLRSHDPHTHRAEEIILMLENPVGESKAEMLIGINSFKGGEGDLFYVGTNLLHGIKNIGTVPCSYFAFQFE